MVTLSTLARSDCAEFIAAAAASKRLHAAWVHPPLDAAAFRARLQRMQPPDNFAFAIRLRASRALVGYADITNVVRGAFMSAYLGYYAFQGHQRQGLMTEGLRLVVRYAFGTLGLHRLEANIQPGNVASIALVKACGFSREGFSPRYLRIGGRWRDHERWALLAREAHARKRIHASLSDLNDAELLQVATPIMDNLMDASTHLDYERHVRDFSEPARASLDEARFRRICEHYQRERGYFAGRELLGILRRPGSVIVAWKQKYSKAQGEYLAELVLAEHGGRPIVERVTVI